MMGNCVLIGAILLIRYKRFGHINYLVSALFAVFAGVLAKEAAFGCIVGGVLICTVRVSDDCRKDVGDMLKKSASPAIDFMVFYGLAFLAALLLGSYWIVLGCFLGYWLLSMYRCNIIDSSNVRKYARFTLILVVTITMSVALFFLLRRMVFTSDAGKIGNTIRLMYMDPNYSISLFIGSFGFYIQKFIFPWPLNFFILEINPLYDFAGIAVVMIMMRLLVQNTISTALFFVGIGLLLPVLPFVFGTIAWTSYAERYIYLPSAFWCITLAIQSAKILKRESYLRLPVARWGLVFLLTMLLIVLSVSSWQRNLVWQKNVTLLQDTVAQSPKAKPLRDFYMAALFYAGSYAEATQQYEIGKLLYSRTYDPIPDVMMAKMLQHRGKNNEAYRLYDRANIKTGFRSEPSLYAMLAFLEVVHTDSNFVLSKTEISQQIHMYRALVKKLHDKSVPDVVMKQKGSHL